jgi:hypothetical protein
MRSARSVLTGAWLSRILCGVSVGGGSIGSNIDCCWRYKLSRGSSRGRLRSCLGWERADKGAEEEREREKDERRRRILRIQAS